MDRGSRIAFQIVEAKKDKKLHRSLLKQFVTECGSHGSRIAFQKEEAKKVRN